MLTFPSVLMTVLFGSMATSGSRAPSHHTDQASTDGSIERLMAKSPQSQEPDTSVSLVSASGFVHLCYILGPFLLIL